MLCQFDDSLSIHSNVPEHLDTLLTILDGIGFLFHDVAIFSDVEQNLHIEFKYVSLLLLLFLILEPLEEWDDFF